MKKIKQAIKIFAVVFVVSINFLSCKKELLNADGMKEQQFELPATAYAYFDKHGVNNDIATLGRVLFYDRNLSVNNAVSCGSCHKQQYAFADNVRFNKGFNGLDLKRNSPSIQGIKGFSNFNMFGNSNGTFTPSDSGVPDKNNQLQVLLFWDGRQRSVADMVLNPVMNHNEMNVPNFETLINKLKSLAYYPDLFKKAYGEETITKEKIAFALEGFVGCLNTKKSENGFEFGFGFENSGQTTNTSDSNLTTLEQQGKFLFHNKYNCAKCHDPSNTGGYDNVTSPSAMFNIGLDEVYADNGLANITGKQGDKGLFKVPTLKNISVTAPYMHDGRFANLGEVLDHYSHNIKPNSNLSSLFLNNDGTPKKMNIKPSEKSAIIAFLNTLKDDDFLTSPMYADPFKNK